MKYIYEVVDKVGYCFQPSFLAVNPLIEPISDTLRERSQINPKVVLHYLLLLFLLPSIFPTICPLLITTTPRKIISLFFSRTSRFPCTTLSVFSLLPRVLSLPLSSTASLGPPRPSLVLRQWNICRLNILPPTIAAPKQTPAGGEKGGTGRGEDG